MPRPTQLLARWPARKAYADAKEAERLGAAVEFTPDDKLAEWLRHGCGAKSPNVVRFDLVG